MFEAAKNGHTDILRILLDKGAKPNIEYVARGRQIAALGLPRENVRPLTVAAGNGQTDAVKLAV